MGHGRAARHCRVGAGHRVLPPAQCSVPQRDPIPVAPTGHSGLPIPHLSSPLAVMNGSSHSPTAINGAPSTPNGFSNGPATSSSASLSTHQLPPACGARQLSKLKRFLTTLQQFGNDISPEIGERVRTLVLGLVVRAWGAAGDAPSLCLSGMEMMGGDDTQSLVFG